MKHVMAVLDYETSERAGAGGFLQVVRLEDLDGDDITSKVDVGRHYESLAELEKDLSHKFGEPVEVEELGA